MENVHPDRAARIMTLSFHEWCMRNYADQDMTQPVTAEGALIADLDSYEGYLRVQGTDKQLRDFREHRQMVRRGPVHFPTGGDTRLFRVESYAHLERFVEAYSRSDLADLGSHFDQIGLYEMASSENAPQWLQTSFRRHLERHCEEDRRELYGQPRREVGRQPIPNPKAARSGFYQFLDESRNYYWEDGNPVLGLLKPLLPVLRHYIGGQAMPSALQFHGWHRQAVVASQLMTENAAAGFQDPLPDRVVNFDESNADKNFPDTLINEQGREDLAASVVRIQASVGERLEQLRVLIQRHADLEGIAVDFDNGPSSSWNDGSNDSDLVEPPRDFRDGSDILNDELDQTDPAVVQSILEEHIHSIFANALDESDDEASTEEDSHAATRPELVRSGKHPSRPTPKKFRSSRSAMG